MRRRAVATLVLCVAALATTPLNDSFGLWVVMLAAAHVGLGVGIGRWWALLVPAVLSVVWFAASGAEGPAYLILILGAPALVPHHTVTRTVYYSDGGGEDTEEITIRQLAEEQLSDLETGGPGCDPQLKRRLRAAF